MQRLHHNEDFTQMFATTVVTISFSKLLVGGNPCRDL